MLCSSLSDWNYFWYKYCNLTFLAICCSQFPLLIILASSWFQKKKIAMLMSLQNKKIIINTWIYSLSSDPHITRFTAVVAKKFRVNLCFGRSNTACRQQMTTEKLQFPSTLINFSTIYFQLVLYFNWIIISNQVKYYLSINRENFLQIQYGFYRHALQIRYLLMIACYWKNMYLERDRLGHHDESSLNLCYCMKSFMEVCLFVFLRGGTEIVNAQSSDKDWYLTSRNKYTDINACYL